ncbi:MAG TPA: choice-of-anchor G family protein, partial [Actinomycetales bacterium]|nr:choice-of-anchor G family protein [Actinomycetales bacterium]
MRKPRPPAAPKRKIKRNTKRIIGLTTAVGMAAALSAPSAFAAPSDDSEAEAHLINLDLNALGLDLDVLDAITTATGYPSEEGPNSAAIDVGVLNALGITLPGISLPLIGDGDNGGLLDLGDQAAAGLLNGYAASPSEVDSLAASGAVGADGAIDVDAGSSTDPARVDLT